MDTVFFPVGPSGKEEISSSCGLSRQLVSFPCVVLRDSCDLDEPLALSPATWGHGNLPYCCEQVILTWTGIKAGVGVKQKFGHVFGLSLEHSERGLWVTCVTLLGEFRCSETWGGNLL